MLVGLELLVGLSLGSGSAAARGRAACARWRVWTSGPHGARGCARERARGSACAHLREHGVVPSLIDDRIRCLDRLAQPPNKLVGGGRVPVGSGAIDDGTWLGGGVEEQHVGQPPARRVEGRVEVAEERRVRRVVDVEGRPE